MFCFGQEGKSNCDLTSAEGVGCGVCVCVCVCVCDLGPLVHFIGVQVDLGCVTGLN